MLTARLGATLVIAGCTAAGTTSAAIVGERLLEASGGGFLSVLDYQTGTRLLNTTFDGEGAMQLELPFVNFLDPRAGAYVNANGPRITTYLSTGQYIGEHELQYGWETRYDTRGFDEISYTIDKAQLTLFGNGYPLAPGGDLSADLRVTVSLDDPGTPGGSAATRSLVNEDYYGVRIEGSSGDAAASPFALVRQQGLAGTLEPNVVELGNGFPTQQFGLRWVGDPLTKTLSVAGLDEVILGYSVFVSVNGNGTDQAAIVEFGDPVALDGGLLVSFAEPPEVVPVPAALPLLATGLAGLVWLRRRRA